MEIAAREAWRSALEAWAIPSGSSMPLASIPTVGSPEFWERMRRTDKATVVDSPTLAVVEELSGGGSVLDVGAGAGRLAIPWRREVTGSRPSSVIPTSLALSSRRPNGREWW